MVISLELVWLLSMLLGKAWQIDYSGRLDWGN